MLIIMAVTDRQLAAVAPLRAQDQRLPGAQQREHGGL